MGKRVSSDVYKYVRVGCLCVSVSGSPQGTPVARTPGRGRPSRDVIPPLGRVVPLLTVHLDE